MGSAFDSEVYAERQRLPGVSIDLERLMRELLWEAGEGEVKVAVRRRPDVASREWWTIEWAEGARAEASELELCLFRAAVLRRRDDERARRYAGMEGRETQS